MKNRFYFFSLYSFFLYSTCSASITFFPIYLKNLGYTSQTIGDLFLLCNLAIVLTPFVLVKSLHSGLAPAKVSNLSNLMMLIAAVILCYYSELVIIAICWMIISGLTKNIFIWEAQALREFSTGKLRFEHIRTAGSIGFILGIYLLGILVDWYSANLIPYFLLITILFTLLTGTIAKGLLNQQISHKNSSFLNLRLLKRLSPILIITILLWIASTPLYVYLSIYLKALNFTASEISMAWNIAVISEIIIFLFFSKIFPKVTPIKALRISIACSIIRWMILATSTNKIIILCSQSLHAFTFGLCYLSILNLTRTYSDINEQSECQAMIQAIGFGLGSILGRIISNILSENLTNDLMLSKMFSYSIIPSLVALIFAFLVKIKQE